MNFDYLLKENLDYIVHYNKTYSPKALNLSCDSKEFDDVVDVAKCVVLLVPIKQVVMFTAYIAENNNSLDAQFLKKSFKNLENFNKTYFKTFSNFPHKDFSFEKCVQTGFDTIINIVVMRLNWLSKNCNQQTFDSKSLIQKLDELDVLNETFYEIFSNFKGINMTFKEAVQNTLNQIFFFTIEPFTSLLLKHDLQTFDDKFLISMFNDVEKIKEILSLTYPKFSHEKYYIFDEFLNGTMEGILTPLLNRVTKQWQDISKIYKEAITMTQIGDLELEYTFQISIKDTKIEELGNELNDIFGKLNLIKDLNKNRFQKISKISSQLYEIMKDMKMNINIITIYNSSLKGRLFLISYLFFF